MTARRGVIGVVVALSIPEAMPERDLILVVAASAITLSVLLQGLTLRAAVARARLADDQEEREAHEARRAIEAAMASPGREHANGFDAAQQVLVRLREGDRIGDELLIEDGPELARRGGRRHAWGRTSEPLTPRSAGRVQARPS